MPHASERRRAAAEAAHDIRSSGEGEAEVGAVEYLPQAHVEGVDLNVRWDVLLAPSDVLSKMCMCACVHVCVSGPVRE